MLPKGSALTLLGDKPVRSVLPTQRHTCSASSQGSYRALPSPMLSSDCASSADSSGVFCICMAHSAADQSCSPCIGCVSEARNGNSRWFSSACFAWPMSVRSSSEIAAAFAIESWRGFATICICIPTSWAAALAGASAALTGAASALTPTVKLGRLTRQPFFFASSSLRDDSPRQRAWMMVADKSSDEASSIPRIVGLCASSGRCTFASTMSQGVALVMA